jgi:hypothetical protein
VVTGVHSRPDQMMFAAGSRQPPVAPTRWGRPKKNEQPRTIAGFTPSAIMSPGCPSPCTQIRQGDVAHPRPHALTPQPHEVGVMT